MDKIVDLSINKVRDAPLEEDLERRIRKVIGEYNGELTYAQTIGVLHILAHSLLEDL